MLKIRLVYQNKFDRTQNSEISSKNVLPERSGTSSSILVDLNHNQTFIKKINFCAELPKGLLPHEIPPGWSYSTVFDLEKRSKDIIGEISRNYFNLLCKYVPMSGYKPVRENEVVVSIGCGSSNEFQALNSYFGRQPNTNSENKHLHVYGIDIDKETIELAERFYRKKLKSHFHFINADATKIATNPAAPEEAKRDVDVAVMGKPYIYDKELWKKIVQSTLGLLREGGILVSTTDSISEHRAMQEIMEELGLKIAVNERSIFSSYQYDPERTLNCDSYILVVKKP